MLKIYRIFLFLLFFIPVIILIGHLGWDFGEYSGYIFSQALNTFYLLILTSFFALLIGGISAWFIALYDFPFKKIIETLFILMMLYPSYVTAIMLSEISSSFIGFVGLVLTLVIATTPYVFLIIVMTLRSQSQQLIETALMFGKNKSWIKAKLLLPLLKPAIIISLIFVISDTMSEFGATYFMGVDTFMTGVYEIWLGLHEPEIGLRLSSLIFIIVIIGVYFSGLFNKNKYFINPIKSELIKPEKLQGIKAWLISFLTFIPVLIGFIIPSFILIKWNLDAWDKTNWSEIIIVGLQSTGISAFVAVLALILSTEILYHFKKDQKKAKIIYSLISSMYALPGIVIAVTMLYLVGIIGFEWLPLFYFYALIIKYIALSMDSIYVGLQKIDRNYYYSAKSFGKSSNWYKWRVQLPLAKKSYIIGGLLVWIDVMRELVIGYILRPQWLDLLSVKIFSFIDLELLYMSGPWILAMVLITLLPIWWVNKLMIKSYN